MVKTLITGSSGFIGGHLKNALPEADGLDIVPSETTNIVCDICEFDNAEEYDIIYHLAAKCNYDFYTKYPKKTYRDNVFGTLNLLSQFKGDKFIFPSSIGVFNKSIRNSYFISKNICEKLFSEFTEKYILFWFSNIYGINSNSVINKFLESDMITINGDGTQVRDFTYIDDLIDWLLKAKDMDNGKYYIGTGEPTSINKIAEIIQRIQPNKTITHVSSRPDEILVPPMPEDLVCNTTVEEGINKLRGLMQK
jgi:UDP-glucose 4-epimerase